MLSPFSHFWFKKKKKKTQILCFLLFWFQFWNRIIKERTIHTFMNTGGYSSNVWLLYVGPSSLTPYSLILHIHLWIIIILSLLLLFPPVVPAQPSGFEAEAELDSRIMLSWLWPVQDPIISFELLYWEANNPTDKVNTTLKTFPFQSRR